MKRNMPSGLISFLQRNPNCIRADLFTITLPNGHTLYATDGQFDIVVPEHTPGWIWTTTVFSASEYGLWSRGAITSEAGFDLSSNTMDLTCIPQQGTMFPGSQSGILFAAMNGLFDACQVTVQTCYMPFGEWGNVSNGIETKFFGQITDLQEVSRSKVAFECADPLYLLNMKVPSRLIQSNCPWGFADVNCGLNPASFTVDFTAAAGTSKWTLVPSSAFSQPAGYYTQGVVKCLTGANLGLSQAVKLHDTNGNLQVMAPWIFPVAAGDTFSVIAGCDKSLTTCTQKFSNQVHFGGMPFSPPPASSI
jgi:uncharacterized phage protein (TIGR02218 family)